MSDHELPTDVQILFVVNTPDVFKSGESTYVIFGEAKIEQDAANSALSANAADFGEAVPDLVPAEAAEAPVAEGTHLIHNIFLIFLKVILRA